MPGKCKFHDAWLNKDVYKDWLMKDMQDIHFARCRACCRSIKLQTMGEAALTSHAGGAGHKAAVRKLIEGEAEQRGENPSRGDGPGGRGRRGSRGGVTPGPNARGGGRRWRGGQNSAASKRAKATDRGIVMTINAAGQINGSTDRDEDNKEQVAISFQQDALDRITGSDWSSLHHSPTTNSTSHNAELQEAAFHSHFFPAPGTSRLVNQRLQSSGSEVEEAGGHRLLQHDSIDLARLELQQRAEALEQQQQMKILEWENRMKVLACEQELVKEKKRAAQQKEKAFRMKKAYYKAKLKWMGEDVPPSSSSSSDEEEENI